jgi:hypothetical protein
VVSANVSIAVGYPLAAVLQRLWFAGPLNIVNPLFAVMLLLIALTVGVFLSAFYAWMARRHLLVWAEPLLGSEEKGAHASAGTMPSIGNSWAALVLSVAMLLVSLGALAATMS